MLRFEDATMTDLYLRTMVRPEAQKQVRKQSLFAAFAALLFILANEFLLPWFQLDSFCLFSRALGTGAVGVSALYHRKFQLQDKQPDILHSTEESLSFFKANEALFTLSWDDIAAFHYVDSGKEYGLAFTLKSAIPEVTDRCRKEHGVDLFLPYFSHGSYLLLEKWRDQHVR